MDVKTQILDQWYIDRGGEAVEHFFQAFFFS